jgi:hypothetical protein
MTKTTGDRKGIHTNMTASDGEPLPAAATIEIVNTMTGETDVMTGGSTGIGREDRHTNKRKPPRKTYQSYSSYANT